jgi:drug/metabolite transporter (DMT)-like permease
MSGKALGLILAVLAAAAFESSYVLLAMQARRVEPVERPGLGFLGRLAMRPWWLGAMVLNGVAFGLELAALRNVSLVVVQPVLGLGLVGLVLASGTFLGEKVDRRTLIAAIAVATGIALVLIGAPSGTGNARLSHAVPSLVVVVALASVMAGPYVRRGSAPAWSEVSAAAAADTLVALSTNQVAREWTGHPGLAVAALAGVAVCGIASVTSESAALQRLPASHVAPIVSAVQDVLPVVLVAVLGHVDWDSASAGGAVFGLGLTVAGIGGYFLARSGVVEAVHTDQAAGGDEAVDGDRLAEPPASVG